MSEPSTAKSDLRNDPPRKSTKRRLIWLFLRIAVVIAILTYIFSFVRIEDLLQAFGHISPVAAAGTIGLGYVGIVVCSFRWYVLMSAYGAQYRPSVLRLFRLQLIGLFFNMFVPGAVGGDVVRGVASRDAFGEGGTTSAITVVLVERAAGLFGLLILATSAFSIHPLPGIGGGVRIWGLLGLSLVVVLVFGVASARRLGGFLPGPLQRIALSLPEIRSLPLFFWVLALSVLSHVVVSLAGHVLVSSMVPQVSLADSMVIIPLAVGAAFFPLTVAGIGAREAAFIVLYTKVGVAEADALAGSLSLLFCQMVIAASGGVLYLLYPLNRQKSSRRDHRVPASR